jgi:hypothetical protein
MSVGQLIGGLLKVIDSLKHETPEDRATAFFVLNYMSNAIDKKRDAVRAKVLEDMGQKSEHRSEKGFTISKDTRLAKLPEEKGLTALLAKANIPLLEVFNEVKSLQLDASKLEYVISLGKLDREEIQKLHKVQVVVNVKASEGLTESIQRDS